jgi:uncharacterized protein YegL
LKIVDFTKAGIFGFVGLLGALVGAIAFEILVPPLPPPPPSPLKSIEVCLLIDCSGSMEERPRGAKSKFDEVKEAAKAFVEENVSKGEIAVVGFGSQALSAARLSTDAPKLTSAIENLQVMGGTAMDLGLRMAAEQFSSRPNFSRYIFLFTDGLPDSRQSTIDVAKQVKSQPDRPIEVVAVGTDGADLAFLAELSGRPSIAATGGKFALAFKEAEKAIYASQSVAGSTATIASLPRLIVQSALWVALIALGIVLALISAQNQYLRRPLLTRSQAMIAIPASLTAGAIAGALGQMIFGLASGNVSAGGAPSILLVIPSRIASWAFLGAFLACGMSLFVPNLKGSRALLGGGLGGAAGAIGFLAASGLGDWLGRMVGASLLGFFIGIMVALVEMIFREGWLEVRYGPKEVRNVSLGGEPISLGSDPGACTIYAANAAPIAYRYWLKNSAIFCEDVAAKRTVTVLPGDRKKIGNLVATVCATAKAGKAAEQSFEEQKRGRQQTVFSLYLSNRKSIDLAGGVTFTAKELPGLHSMPPGGVVARVNQHPTDPLILGLQNLSQSPWRVCLPNGDKIEIKPTKNVRLTLGTQIDFGSIQGEIKT